MEREQSHALKYYEAWLNASDAQRIALCTRFGLTYTYKGDLELLEKVANKQQQAYLRSKLIRKQEWEQMVQAKQNQRSQQANPINSLKVVKHNTKNFRK